jgi:hypothetical protein
VESSGAGMDWRQPRGTKMRLLAVGMCLVALTAGYILLLRHFNVSELPVERYFGAAGAVEPAGQVYLEPVSIDPLDESMQMRAYLSPSSTDSKDVHGAPSRDLTLLVTHDKTVEEVKLAAGDHMASSIFEIDLNDGSVADYPLDSYVARLGVQLLDGKSSQKLPARVTVWEGLLGYSLHTTSQPEADPEDVELTTSIRRGGAFTLFALCAYTGMVVLGLCALAIGVLTFTDVRQHDTAFIGSLAAIAFTLPVLRNTMPGSPPLGVQADMWVFLWAELAAVLALALVVFKWVKAGPRP